MKLSCIIVDDDPFSGSLLQKLCEQHELLNVQAVFENPQEALLFLQNEQVDLVWLDVEMPQLTGFELLKNIVSVPYVIMTTSSIDYAFEAFQHQVSDFIQKPISVSRFKEAVEKVVKNFKVLNSSNSKSDSIFVKADGKFIKLNSSEISYLENIGDYVRISTDNQTLTIHATMKYLEVKLGHPFMRVHRSFIVNINKIVDIEENNLVIGKKVIPISRANKAELLSKLNML